MSAPSPTAPLEAALHARGLLPAGWSALEAPPARPWFVSLLLGGTGWLAGLSGLGFLGAIFHPATAGAFLAIGLLLLGVAFALYRAPAGAFIEQVALAVSMAGQVSLTVALGIWTESAGGTAAAVVLLQGAWLLAAPNRTARLLAALFGCVAWALAVRFAWWGHDFTSPAAEVSLSAALAGWFLVWGPVALGAWRLLAAEVAWLSAGRQRLLRPLLTGLLLALCFGTLASQPLQGLLLWSPQGPPRSSWLALWPLLSAGAALFALAGASALRSRALMGAAIAAALLHVLHFYLLVGTTLLVKSAIMAGVGLVLLAVAVLLDRRGRGP